MKESFIKVKGLPGVPGKVSYIKLDDFELNKTEVGLEPENLKLGPDLEGKHIRELVKVMILISKFV